MNQVKTGSFLKELRKEKNWTQEQLAEKLNVSNRSISRWENGKTMPDFDLIIQLSQMYKISIEEILDGQRKEAGQKKQSLSIQTAQEISQLTSDESQKRYKIIHYTSLTGIIGLLMTLCIEFGEWNNPLANFCFGLGIGLSLGSLIVSFLFTSIFYAKLSLRKKKILSLPSK